LGDDELEQKTSEFRERLAKGEDLNGSLLEETFAVVREAAWYVHIRLLYLVCVCVCVYAAAECCY
jgi:preprotein translocase subunit SecA